MVIARYLHVECPQGGAAPLQRPPQAHSGYFAKMLTSTLKTLETDGYINRKVYAEVPQEWSIHLPLEQNL